MKKSMMTVIVLFLVSIMSAPVFAGGSGRHNYQMNNRSSGSESMMQSQNRQQSQSSSNYQNQNQHRYQNQQTADYSRDQTQIRTHSQQRINATDRAINNALTGSYEN